jgi:hypothetical protein
MKKVIISVYAITFLFLGSALTACGSNNGSDSTQDTSGSNGEISNGNPHQGNTGNEGNNATLPPNPPGTEYPGSAGTGTQSSTGDALSGH